MKNKSHPLKNFLILWRTQSVSQLGSSITAFALTLWLYETTGSSLSTAALTICSYAPYVLMSIFAGVLTDRLDKKKIMLVCDLLAVLCTIAVFALFRTNHLMVWHLYALNIISGLMNTVQQPASEVDTDYSRTVLSKNKCTSFSIPVIDLHIKSLDCYRLVRFCRTEWRRGSRCRKLYNCIYGAAVFCFTSKEQEREKRKRLSSCKRRSGILETQSYDFDAAVVFVGHQFCIFCF